jgi:hypothetical protein
MSGSHPAPVPENLDGFQEWCEIHLAGAVELHNRAYQGVKASEYHDPRMLYRALLLLKEHYVPMRRQGGKPLVDAFHAACQALGLREEPTFSGSRWGEEGETYLVRYAASAACSTVI